MPNKIPVFHIWANCYFHLNHYEEPAEEFERKFTCSGENTEKSITFSVPIEKEATRIDKKGKEIT